MPQLPAAASTDLEQLGPAAKAALDDWHTAEKAGDATADSKWALYKQAQDAADRAALLDALEHPDPAKLPGADDPP